MTAPSQTILIGLTGGIASGKSTVLKTLVDAGASVIDADKMGHKAYLPGTECLGKMVEHFGDRILAEDGTVDRKVLGGIVFSDKMQLEALNSIVWPAIQNLIMEEFESIKERNKSSNEVNIVVIEAAILVEAGWMDMLDQIWVTTVGKETQLKRLMERNGFSKEEAEKRINAQISDEERVKYADVVFNNNGGVEELESAVRKEVENLKKKFSSL